MRLHLRLILFFVLFIWMIGIFYECSIGIFDSLIYGYPLIHKTYSIVCHQDPQKLINISCGKSLVCARCLGIYSGLLISSVFFLFYIPKIKRGLTILLISSIPMIIDVIATTFGFYNYSKGLAFSTGLLFGSILFLYLYDGLENLISELQKR